MPRFKNSNRLAAEEMKYTAGSKTPASPNTQLERSYFRRIGFDFAML